jgi:GGDEF domain-containing protein
VFGYRRLRVRLRRLGGHAADNEVDPQILLKKADLELYRAKAAGQNRLESS